MEYTCEVTIDSTLEKVFKLFEDNMLVGKRAVPGNVSQMVFTYDGIERTMTETIESVYKPYEIVSVYEVEDTYNRCVIKFKVDHLSVVFRMEVEFRFKEELNQDIEKYAESTLNQMTEFKKFVESIEENY
ncbi:hypothetical protein [Acholeplasma hippikon]|uniref:Polyketide cyclase / dehydrase and lipid transport n=1 Tax=Acholeplasma hippikon TaxID=264636 RepID=A0A449BJ21_9MOLU|nr:hypothetical protein [Acholeplasma hippikon]VEU82430.1 Uncharacterised protein [Acholeplasma hippikon]